MVDELSRSRAQKWGGKLLEFGFGTEVILGLWDFYLLLIVSFDL